MKCPNCGRDSEAPTEGFEIDQYGHHEGCAISMLLGVLDDRGFDITRDYPDVSNVDATFLWDTYLGPAADALAGMLDLGGPHPPERTE